jgi:hypothetical protein
VFGKQKVSSANKVVATAPEEATPTLTTTPILTVPL